MRVLTINSKLEANLYIIFRQFIFCFPQMWEAIDKM